MAARQTARTILLSSDQNDPARALVDEARDVSVQELGQDYQIVVEADGLTSLPILAAGVKAAFICRDLYAFLRLKQKPIGGDLVFAPSLAAKLDLQRQSRRTLVATRSLAEGHVLEDEDIGDVQGGSGLGVEMRDAVIGRFLHYDIAQGGDIDFGMISEDPVGET